MGLTGYSLYKQEHKNDVEVSTMTAPVIYPLTKETERHLAAKWKALEANSKITYRERAKIQKSGESR
jgi:hypothetical protein